MDERKKEIRALEDKNREDLGQVEQLLAGLGGRVLSRINDRAGTAALSPGPAEDADPAMGADAPSDPVVSAALPDGMPLVRAASYGASLEEFRRFDGERQDIRAQTRAINDDIERVKELDEAMASLSLESSGIEGELKILYRQLGEYVLADPDLGDFSSPFKGEADQTVLKIGELHERLEEMDGQEGEGFFTKIGKGAQSLVLRSRLGKNQGSLDRLYSVAGERFVFLLPRPIPSGPEANRLLEEDRRLKDRKAALDAEYALFQEERRQITNRYADAGGTVKRISVLTKRLGYLDSEVLSLYRRFGVLIEKGAENYAPFLEGADRNLLEQSGEFRRIMAERSRDIAKIQITMAIDEERGAIEEMERSLRTEESRIAAAQDSIKKLNAKITASRGRIGELEQNYAAKDGS